VSLCLLFCLHFFVFSTSGTSPVFLLYPSCPHPNTSHSFRHFFPCAQELSFLHFIYSPFFHFYPGISPSCASFHFSSCILAPQFLAHLFIFPHTYWWQNNLSGSIFSIRNNHHPQHPLIYSHNAPTCSQHSTWTETDRLSWNVGIQPPTNAA